MTDASGRLPVTIPINATEDRVVGGWKLDALMKNKPARMEGLLKNADGGILYIDEVNLLDDHIVNIILDVSSTGILEIQRDALDDRQTTNFTLVGTMNPEEGGLRPQLLDRFALAVQVSAEDGNRGEILRRCLEFDKAISSDRPADDDFFLRYHARDQEKHSALKAARDRNPSVTSDVIDKCVSLASRLGTGGHRGERVLLLAARAHAALTNKKSVHIEDVRRVAPLALQHRQNLSGEMHANMWGESQWAIVDGS